MAKNARIESLTSDVASLKRQVGTVERDVGLLRQDIRSFEKSVEAISRAIADISPLLPSSPPRKRRLNVALLVSIVAAVIALLAWLQRQWSAHTARDNDSNIDTRIEFKLKEPLERLSNQATQLYGLSSAVQQIWKDLDLVLMKDLRILSQLPQKQFDKNLSQVAAVLQAAYQKQIPIEHDLLSELKGKLVSADPTAEAYCDAVAATVSYEAWTRFPSISPMTAGTLTDCVTVRAKSSGLNIENNEGPNCALNLEDVDLSGGSLDWK